jgi:arginyl-tRNA synthetase
MLLVKQELLAALANTLESLSPGAGSKAAFESPKVAAHGDFASTAAMQLAKPLGRKPRELAEQLSATLLATPAFRPVGRGHRDRRSRLPQHPPEDRRQAADRARGAGRRRRLRPPAGHRATRCWSSSSRPTRPARCTSATAARRRWATPSATCARRRARRLARVLLQRRRRADPDAGQQHAAARPRLQARRRRMAERRKGGGLQRRLHRRHRRRLQGEEDRQSPTTANTPPAATSNDIDSIREVRRGLPAPRAGPGPAGLPRAFDNYYLESSLYTSGRVAATVQKLVDGRQDLRAGRRAVAQVDRLRRRQGPRHAQARRHVHVLRARRGVPHRQVGARLPPRCEHPGHRPPRHHRPGARRPAGGGRRHPEPATPTTCSTPWCAWSRGARK